MLLRIVLFFALAVLSSAACGTERGLASYYRGTAAGQMTCAHRTRPFGTMITVTHGHRTIQCRVTDRGPFKHGRIIDLSISAAKALGMMGAGIVPVTLQ
jgi:rare lipoprotein A